jgi:alcohol dehydrogenase
MVRNADVNLVALPDDVDDVTAAGLGCRFATAFRALTAHGRPEPDQWVAVHGCGGVGLSAVMIAVALGARVVATDPSPAARAAASDLGAEVVLDAKGDAEALAADVRAASAGGTHVSVDAIGSQAALAAGLAGLRPRGRHVQVGLMLGDDARPDVPLGRLVAEELSVHGSHGMSAADYPAMLAMVASGALQPRRLVGRVIGLDQAGAAVAAMSTAPAGAGMTVVRLGALDP